MGNFAQMDPNDPLGSNIRNLVDQVARWEGLARGHGHEDMITMFNDAQDLMNYGPRPDVDWRKDLVAFYKKYGMDDKLDGVDEALAKWKGKESKMMRTLHKKYAAQIEAYEQKEYARVDEL